ncbi:MAG: DMT family transporter [Proteobacteria bacterium]|nr:DMT family transporter [Pseudomonadota bacterium]MDA1058357.1 DMT family transporter [Pseudomonadota bacterium]
MPSFASLRSIPQPVVAALYMLAATVLFSIMVASVRHVSSEVDSFEIVFFRNLLGIFIIGPIIARRGLGFLRTTRLRLYAWRAAFGLGSMFMWFYAITVTPIAEAVALSFTSPLFVTVIAVFFLHEKVGAPRWIATAIGFGGAMIVLRPGIAEVTTGHMLLIASSILMAVSIVSIKMLARTESPERIVAYMVIIFTPVSLIPALFVWEWPSLNAWFWLFVVAGAGTFAHIAFTRALSKADASAVMPLDFMRLPATAVIGYLAFSEIPDVWTFAGAVVIFVSSVYIARRENQDRRAVRAAAQPVA